MIEKKITLTLILFLTLNIPNHSQATLVNGMSSSLTLIIRKVESYYGIGWKSQPVIMALFKI